MHIGAELPAGAAGGRKGGPGALPPPGPANTGTTELKTIIKVTTTATSFFFIT